MGDRDAPQGLDESASQLSAGGATGGGGYGDTLATTNSGLGGTVGGKTAKKAVAHDNFRGHNVRFLQEQNKEVTRELDKLEEERDEALAKVARWEEKKHALQVEYGSLVQQEADVEEKCALSAAEIHKRDEQIRLLSAQNRELLDLLEQEEKQAKEREEQAAILEGKRAKLQNISDLYDNLRSSGNQQLASAYTEIAKFEEELRNSQNETEQLKEAERNFTAQARIDIESLEKKLKDAKEKNVTHLQQIQHNEVHEHRMIEAIQRLKETLDELTVQKKGIRMQLDMDVEHRDKWTQSKSEVERRKEMLDKTVSTLRLALKESEEHNRSMQEENKQGADKFRQLGDKVYHLMDQLRQHQMDLRKQEQSGVEKQRRIVALDKQSQQLQQQLQVEVDAKLAAESEARNAAQMQALLQKKNKMLDEALCLALRAQEKVEKRLQELHDKSNALQTQNDYLETRIDGNEEDKGALKYELRRMEEELRQVSATNSQLHHQHTEVEDRFNDLEAEKASFKAELDYVKREDMLDETGRTKPILIESDSKLIERLQINEFLFSAQQARNPVPMLVEKVSDVLEMLHTAQTQADLYLQDLQRSNTMLTALRQKNMGLYEKVQMCETWKMRALLKIASNAFEMRTNVKGHNTLHAGQNLYLDGLQYGNKELKELYRVIADYGKADTVKEIRLRDNGLNKSSVPQLTDLINQCSYLTTLDLRQNKLDEPAIADIQGFVERIPGVTSIIRLPATGDIQAKSGNQVRLTVKLDDQGHLDPDDVASANAADMFAEDPGGMAADNFLTSAAGITNQGKLQGPDLLGSGGASGGRTVLPGQRAPGTGQLPRIPSASRSRR